MTAALYARISSLKDDRGVSVERQIDECLKLAKSHGFTVPPELRFLDNGKSGKNLKRAAMQQLIAAIQAGKVTHLFAYEMPRLSRSVRDTADLLDLFAKYKVELHLVSGFADITTPEGELLTGFQAQMAQYWQRKTSRAIRAHYDNLRSHGVYLGRKHPFGLLIVGNGKQRHLEPDPATFHIVKEFLENYAAGRAYGAGRGIALLVAKGYRWRDIHGKPRNPVPTDFRTILNNLSNYTQFLSPSLARKVQAVYASRRNRRGNSRMLKYHSLLRGCVACAACGSRLIQKYSTATNRGYRHRFGECAHSGKSVNFGAPDAYILGRLSELERLTPAQRQQIRKYLLTPPHDPFAAQRAAKERLARQLDKLIDEWLEAGLTPDQFRKKQADLQARLDEIQDLPPPPQSRLPADVDALLANLSANLLRAVQKDTAQGNALVRSLFREITFDFATRQTQAKFTWE